MQEQEGTCRIVVSGEAYMEIESAAPSRPGGHMKKGTELPPELPPEHFYFRPCPCIKEPWEGAGSQLQILGDAWPVS